MEQNKTELELNKRGMEKTAQAHGVAPHGDVGGFRLGRNVG
jgi:hypothetical protein